MRVLAAEVHDQPSLWAAGALQENIIADVLCSHDGIVVNIPSNVPMSSVASFLQATPQTEWSDEMSLVYGELHTVRGAAVLWRASGVRWRIQRDLASR